MVKAVDEYHDFDQSFETVINEVIVEQIDEQENSIIESAAQLNR